MAVPLYGVASCCSSAHSRQSHVRRASWNTYRRQRREALRRAHAHETAANGAHVTEEETTTTTIPSLRDVYVRIHHVAIIVKNLERTLAFYEDVLGFTRDESRPNDKLPFRGAFLRVGAEPEDAQAAGGPQAQTIHVMELANPDPMEGRPEHGGRDRHFCIAVTDTKPIEERLDAAGVSFTKSKSGRPAIFFRDPDMNTIEAAVF